MILSGNSHCAQPFFVLLLVCLVFFLLVPSEKRRQTLFKKEPRPKEMKRRCFVVWFGPNMTGTRQKAYTTLRDSINRDNVTVELVTSENWMDYQVRGHPIHPAATLEPGMSGIHRGDYMRVYLMHHYGGCYHDIKYPKGTPKLSRLFDKFVNNTDLWMIGSQEKADWGVACGSFYADHLNISCPSVFQNWKKLYSNVHYMMRPGTPLTWDWLRLVELRLDELYPTIQEHPSPVAGRCCQNDQDPKGYPVGFTELHGDCFHPLHWLYRDHIQPGFPNFKKGARSTGTEDN